MNPTGPACNKALSEGKEIAPISTFGFSATYRKNCMHPPFRIGLHLTSGRPCSGNSYLFSP
jgi:hypothetical protein